MAFRTQKISQMTPKGANLEATDLIEVSTIESGSYVTRSITGQEIIDGIPPAAAAWGSITGTLSSQTDLQSALNAKQDTLTLTTTGTSGAATLVGSTLNIPQYSGGASGITIGTTAITSGTVGRILFEGAGNVVQESGNLFWDNTNVRLGIGTSTPSHAITIENASQPSVRLVDTTNAAYLDLNIGNFDATISSNGRIYINSTTTFSANATNVGIGIANPINAKFQVVGTVLFSSGNVIMNSTSGNTLIGTTTDAGFRLDVNGDTRSTNIYTGTIFARSSGLIYSAAGAGNSFTHFFTVGNNQNATSGNAYLVAISSTFNPTSGTATFDGLRIANTINQTGGANGITRGLYVNPTLTAAADFRAIETARGNVVFGNLPTSSAGLPTGAIWNDAGTLKIV